MLSDRPDWAIDGRDWPNHAASRFVEAGRVRFHVQVMGAGPVVLLIHGTGAATHSWRDVAPLLARHFTVVAPDLPGHGFTTGRPVGGLSMAAMARAVGELMAALGLAPDLVIGHSAGAAIAARMVLDGIATPRALIGLNPALMPFPGLAARIFPTLAKLLFVNPFAPHIFARIASTPGEVERFLVRSTGSKIDAVGVECYARLFRRAGHCAGAITMMAEWDLDALYADLPGLTLPVTLIHGDGDAAVPADGVRHIAERLPDAQVDMLAGLGHLAHEEAPALVAERIRRIATADATA
ncbi:MAG: alpha/beta fold hydrolase BchO [Sphingomonas sp.]